jgi:phage baseplate assembly protein W
MSYGNNIQLSDDFDIEFSPTTKSLNMIAGADNLEQSIKIILNTFEGENKFVANFGTRLQDLIGYKASDNFIKYTVKNALLKDSRIKSIDKIYVSRSVDRVVSLKITLTTADEQTLELTGGLGWNKLV